MLEFTIWISFTTGLVTGASACMLLLLSVLGTSLTMVESRSKYLLVSIGLILGIIVAYLTVTAVFLAMTDVFGVITYLKYIFGGIFLVIGSWQIIEFNREKAIIFGTPNKVKSYFKWLIDKKSGFFAFVLGLIFAFVKIPCFGAPYLELLFVSQNDPLITFLIIFYLIGTIIPIAIVLLAIRVGFQSEKLSEIRLKYRPHLRLLSGVFIITLTLYLILDTYISIELILWIILIEMSIFLIAIWLKSGSSQQDPH